MAIYHKKFLEDGVTPNPKHRPHKSGASGKSVYHKKFLEDGVTPNPKHRPHKSGTSGKSVYHKKFLEDGVTPNPKHRPHKSGASGKSGKGGKTPPNFIKGNFIAIDGEGTDINGKHEYNYLAYTGGSVFNPNGLTSKQCFDTLLEMGRKNPKGIFCIFAGGYDANMWLKDVPKSIIEYIIEADGQYPIYWEDYGIRFIQRRFFTIQKRGAPKEDKPVKIWDVWGFFQGTFIAACKTWIPHYDKLDLIIQGKAARVNFQDSDVEFMKRYNEAELEALVLLMEKLREALVTMGLTLSGWHGAGAVATAIYKVNEIKQHLETPPPKVYTATKHAYFGGRIEICKYGSHNGVIHHYDINSAYPAQQRNLPSLKDGQWIKRGKGFDSRTTDNIVISLINWEFNTDETIYPFPLRSSLQRKVLFPQAGINWIWKPESDAGLKWHDIKMSKYPHSGDYVEILDSYEFIPANSEKPFGFIDTYYNERKRIVAETKRTGIPNGVQVAIKLGINSLYGKLAQRIGYDKKTGRIPPYHNLIYAGFITSATRAQLYDAAMQKPECIIAMATDGLYSTEPLDLECPEDKELGKWEYQAHTGMNLVQSGFYFIHDGEKISAFSRGFDRMATANERIETLNKIRTAWRNNQQFIFLPCTRFVTLKSALCGGDWWERWRSWYKYKTIDKKTGIEYDGRKLAITPLNTKRVPLNAPMAAKGKRRLTAADILISTKPEQNFFPETMSEQHDIPWDTEGLENGVSALEITLEHDIDSMI